MYIWNMDLWHITELKPELVLNSGGCCIGVRRCDRFC